MILPFEIEDKDGNTKWRLEDKNWAPEAYWAFSGSVFNWNKVISVP